VARTKRGDPLARTWLRQRDIRDEENLRCSIFMQCYSFHANLLPEMALAWSRRF